MFASLDEYLQGMRECPDEFVGTQHRLALEFGTSDNHPISVHATPDTVQDILDAMRDGAGLHGSYARTRPRGVRYENKAIALYRFSRGLVGCQVFPFPVALDPLPFPVLETCEISLHPYEPRGPEQRFSDRELAYVIEDIATRLRASDVEFYLPRAKPQESWEHGVLWPARAVTQWHGDPVTLEIWEEFRSGRR